MLRRPGSTPLALPASARVLSKAAGQDPLRAKPEPRPSPSQPDHSGGSGAEQMDLIRTIRDEEESPEEPDTESEQEVRGSLISTRGSEPDRTRAFTAGWGGLGQYFWSAFTVRGNRTFSTVRSFSLAISINQAQRENSVYSSGVTNTHTNTHT